MSLTELSLCSELGLNSDQVFDGIISEEIKSRFADSKPTFDTEAPVKFVVQSICTNNLKHLCVQTEAHYSSFEASGILPAIYRYLSDHNQDLAALECLAFCKYEKSADLDIEIDPNIDFQFWANFKEKNEYSTSAGRFKTNASTSRAQQRSMSLFEDEGKGYMTSRPWILELLICSQLKTKVFVDKWWPLVIPAILNYLDTADPLVKARAIALVDLLVTNHPARLNASGLVPIFEQSVETCLHFLPPMSEQNITIAVHRPSLLCLAKLAKSSDMFSNLGEASGSPAPRVTEIAKRNAQLSKKSELNQKLNSLAREGALKPFVYADENVDLCIYFLETLSMYVDGYLQSLTVIHLHGIVQLLNQILSDPFIEYSPQLIEQACATMSSVIRWCWPRIKPYKYTLILGLAKAKALDSECFKMLDPTEEEVKTLKQLVESR